MTDIREVIQTPFTCIVYRRCRRYPPLSGSAFPGKASHARAPPQARRTLSGRRVMSQQSAAARALAPIQRQVPRAQMAASPMSQSRRPGRAAVHPAMARRAPRRAHSQSRAPLPRPRRPKRRRHVSPTLSATTAAFGRASDSPGHSAGRIGQRVGRQLAITRTTAPRAGGPATMAAMCSLRSES